MNKVSSSFNQIFNNQILNAKNLEPCRIREICRRNEMTHSTLGVCKEYLQCNIIILPKDQAFDFLLFCQRNPQSCPLVEVTDPGVFEPACAQAGADLRTDLPKYKLYDLGEPVADVTNIDDIWYDDFVCFLIASTMAFENTLREKNIPVRHIEEGRNMPIYKTNIKAASTPLFSVNQYVSMCPMRPDQAIEAIKISQLQKYSNGVPIHIGNPGLIGINNLDLPDYGDKITIDEGEIPVFWCHDYTAQIAIMQSKTQTAIMSIPGFMFITDISSSAN